MLLAASTGRCKVELARVGLNVRDKFGNGFCRDGGTYLHNKRRAVKACDRCDVADEVEIEIVVERCIDRVWWNASEKPMAVRGCSYDRLCANIAGRTRPVSMMKGWPSRSDSHWPTRRTIISTPPAGKPTTIRTGRDG